MRLIKEKDALIHSASIPHHQGFYFIFVAVVKNRVSFSIQHRNQLD